ncbi:MAG: MurR/RpiR family transcriptional regulator, partial [Chloroflexota bacterium]|nr:MurR/RpiR family transcriptional regulator [Chloroflexota bacterium]
METQPTFSKIRAELPNMTRTQRKIADFILKNPSILIKNSITDICEKSGVKSPASIVRFYKLLDFSGYKEFKITIAQELARKTFYHSYEDINIDDSPDEIKNKIFSGAISTLVTNSRFDNMEEYKKARDLILKSNRIIFLGYAASAAICYYAYFRFTELGFNCHFFSDSHINATVLARPNPDDLVFCISYSGETKDIIAPLENIAHKDISTIALTSNSDSSLSDLADVVLLTQSDEENI